MPVACALALLPAVGRAQEPAATAYPIPTAGGFPAGLAVGPDGNLWFTEVAGNKVGRMTPAGVVTEFPVATSASRPTGIAAGPDGNLWFTEAAGNKIGRIATDGTITEFAVPTPNSSPNAITSGPDGGLWFTEANYNEGNRVGRIAPDTGVVQEFCIRQCGATPQPRDAGLRPAGITTGPDGRLWFALQNPDPGATGPNPYGDAGTPIVGAIATDGTVSEYPLTTADARPKSIVPGPDGNLWVTEFLASKIARVTPAGDVKEFFLPSASAHPAGIASGPRGQLWFTEFDGDRIGAMTTDGAVAELDPVDVGADLNQIVVGPDGQLWATESRYGQIWRFTVESAPAPEAVDEPEPAPETTPEPATEPQDTRVSPVRVTIAGRKLRTRRGVVRIRARGTVVPPQGQPISACSGDVVVEVLRRRRVTRRVNAKLTAACRFKKVIRVPQGYGRLRVRARFAGNDLLLPMTSPLKRVRTR